MSTEQKYSKTIAAVLASTPHDDEDGLRKLGFGLAALGVLGLLIAGLGGGASFWTGLVTATSLIIGIAAVGAVFSAIFQLTGARWGRGYRRIGEAFIALAPVGLAATIIILIGGGVWLPWAGEHHLTGGKHLWLVRGFWDLRILLCLAAGYGLSILFIYYSVRRDLTMPAVRRAFSGPIAARIGRGLEGLDETEAARESIRCDEKMSLLSPVLLLVFAVAFSLIGFDLIMALDPAWFSTLFGAWFFMGHLFSGMALLAILSVFLAPRLNLDRFITRDRRADMATILFAFCLLNMDFFWSQYFTIWYANLPEETEYLITRSLDHSLPFANLGWIALFSFLFIPFFALLFRKVKAGGLLLSVVSLVVVVGIFLARFIEIAPEIMHLPRPSAIDAVALPLIGAALIFIGLLGAGLVIYARIISEVPIFPIGDKIFREHYSLDEDDR